MGWGTPGQPWLGGGLGGVAGDVPVAWPVMSRCGRRCGTARGRLSARRDGLLGPESRGGVWGEPGRREPRGDSRPRWPPRQVPVWGEGGTDPLPPRRQNLRVSTAPQGCCPLPHSLRVPHRHQCHGRGGAEHPRGDTGLARTGDTVQVPRGVGCH